MQVLETFKKKHTQVAFVVDEYGNLQGLVTLVDVMEAIVGDIATEELQDSEAVKREDGSWLMDGAIAVKRLIELLDIDDLPGEEEVHFNTLGGFVMTQLG